MATVHVFFSSGDAATVENLKSVKVFFKEVTKDFNEGSFENINLHNSLSYAFIGEEKTVLAHGSNIIHVDFV